MSIGFQKPKIKSRSAGPGGKKPGTSCHGKNPVSLSIAAIPKDLPPGSSDWVAAKKNSGTSSASGREGGPKRTVGWPSGRGPKGTIRDPEDYVILIAGIFPRASSNGAHGSQSDDSTYLVSDMRCSLYLTLDQQVVFSVARITGVANPSLRMWSSSKKHQLILTLAPGPGVEPGSRGHEADALPLSYPYILTRRIFRLWFRRLVPPPTSWTTRMPWIMGPRTAIGGQTPRICLQDPLTGWMQKIPALPPHLGRRVGQSGPSGGQVDGVQRGRFGTRRIFRLWFRQLVPPPTLLLIRSLSVSLRVPSCTGFLH